VSQSLVDCVHGLVQHSQLCVRERLLDSLGATVREPDLPALCQHRVVSRKRSRRVCQVCPVMMLLLLLLSLLYLLFLLLLLGQRGLLHRESIADEDHAVHTPDRVSRRAKRNVQHRVHQRFVFTV
jgi:hypothetical protein